MIFEWIFLLSPLMWIFAYHVENLHFDPSSDGVLIVNLVHYTFCKAFKGNKVNLELQSDFQAMSTLKRSLDLKMAELIWSSG